MSFAERHKTERHEQAINDLLRRVADLESAIAKVQTAPRVGRPPKAAEAA